MAYKVLTHPLPVNLFRNLDVVKSLLEVSGTKTDTAYGVYGVGKDVLCATKIVKRTEANAVAQARGAIRLSNKAAEKRTKATIKKANIQKRTADKAAEAAKAAKADLVKTIVKGIGQISLGILGGIAAYNIDNWYGENYKNISVKII